jgi:hypothetical protein
MEILSEGREIRLIGTCSNCGRKVRCLPKEALFMEANGFMKWLGIERDYYFVRCTHCDASIDLEEE